MSIRLLKILLYRYNPLGYHKSGSLLSVSLEEMNTSLLEIARCQDDFVGYNRSPIFSLVVSTKIEQKFIRNPSVSMRCRLMAQVYGLHFPFLDNTGTEVWWKSFCIHEISFNRPSLRSSLPCLDNTGTEVWWKSFCIHEMSFDRTSLWSSLSLSR